MEAAEEIQKGGVAMTNGRSLSNVCQICLVVKDIRKSMKRYSEIMGIGPFSVYQLDANKGPGFYYRGKPANFVAEVGIATCSGWELELAQHVSGESIYKEFIEKYGEGVQHLGVEVDDFKKEYDKLVREGFEPIMGGPIPGKDRVGRFDYFESQKKLGTIIELLDVPEVRGDPSYVYP